MSAGGRGRAGAFLALRMSLDLRGRQFDLGGGRAVHGLDVGFPPHRAAGTAARLLVSGYWALRPRWLQHLVSVAVLEPAHWVMQTRQFANLKRRAEAPPGRADPEAPAGHAASPRHPGGRDRRGAVPELSRRDVLRWSALGLAAARSPGAVAHRLRWRRPAGSTSPAHDSRHLPPLVGHARRPRRGRGRGAGVSPPPRWPRWTGRDGEGAAVRLGPGRHAGGDRRRGPDMARTVNDVGAELAKDHPALRFLATLPLPALTPPPARRPGRSTGWGPMG